MNSHSRAQLYLFDRVGDASGILSDLAGGYSQWEQLSDEERLGYLAGAIYTLIASPVSAAIYYNTCVSNSHMKLTQLDTNVRAYVRTKPALQGGGMAGA